MTYWMGIDGGGSNLRVVVTAADLTVLAQAHGETANPSIIGRNASAGRIQAIAADALSQAGLLPADVSGIGIGIAGASVAHSENWLRDVAAVIAPGIPVVLSSDSEIALVGANGERQGVLVLAGTGSVAFGVNRSGETCQVGGWGYLLGDEGSSYWIGIKALQHLSRAGDGREATTTSFNNHLLAALGLKAEIELVRWLYRSDEAHTREIAQLARIVLDEASDGLEIAVQIVEAAAGELTLLCRTTCDRLNMKNPHIAFAGGLLDNDNFLSRRLCQLLNLDKRPIPLYPPVIGAALLAQLVVKG